MKDVQNEPDHRKIDLTRVGIKGIKYPMNVLDRTNKTQATVATVNMYVHLPHRFKGTHMSRFVEVLNDYYADLNLKTFFEMIDKIKKSLDAPAANLEISFPYFMKKRAPVSDVPSMMEYTCNYVGEIIGEDRRLYIGITVPVCTLCPCSKEISTHGAHNQRGNVSVKVLFKDFFWIEEIIEIVEGSASSDVFALLKREDEKFITEQAYNRPMFVEDVVREVTDKLGKDERFVEFTVEAENFESIHNHSAYAFTEVVPQS
ncbi:MAG: GTP cyclohydrolase I FolE2 [Deltaproteobacteria bacterium]|nr:GTP cyclohydrolase I FolE2 [Deltaproteobacteria bacterium]